ncbi:MAG: hypothetical protein Q8P30_04370 [Candidatus Uhrbacteria bacterium]|nr:hypothetical protein [Candidatus Uhrbacteria bacterium]
MVNESLYRQETGEIKTIRYEVQEIPHILPEDFAIPDMSPIDLEKDGFRRTHEVFFDFTFDGEPLVGKITFERVEDEDQSDTAKGIARLDLETFEKSDDKYPKRLSIFKSILLNKQDYTRNEFKTKDRQPHKFWRIHTRRVEKPMRGKNFGEWNLKVIEEAMRRVVTENDELNADWIEIITGLGSLSNLIVDPDWLEDTLNKEPIPGPNEERLIDRAERKDRNLGYIAHPVDKAAALQLLQKRTTELADIPVGQREVTFVKSIKPSFSPEEDFRGPGEDLW